MDEEEALRRKEEALRSETVVPYYARIYLAGLLAISLVLLPVFFSERNLDQPAFISVIALAIAIPALASSVLATSFFDLSGTSPSIQLTVMLLVLIAVLAILVSIISAFWHITPIAGVVFLGTTVILGAFMIYFFRNVAIIWRTQ